MGVVLAAPAAGAGLAASWGRQVREDARTRGRRRGRPDDRHPPRPGRRRADGAGPGRGPGRGGHVAGQCACVARPAGAVLAGGGDSARVVGLATAAAGTPAVARSLLESLGRGLDPDPGERDDPVLRDVDVPRCGSWRLRWASSSPISSTGWSPRSSRPARARRSTPPPKRRCGGWACSSASRPPRRRSPTVAARSPVPTSRCRSSATGSATPWSTRGPSPTPPTGTACGRSSPHRGTWCGDRRRTWSTDSSTLRGPVCTPTVRRACRRTPAGSAWPTTPSASFGGRGTPAGRREEPRLLRGGGACAASSALLTRPAPPAPDPLDVIDKVAPPSGRQRRPIGFSR